MEMEIPFDPVCPSSVGLSVCHNFLKGQEVTVPRTCCRKVLVTILLVCLAILALTKYQNILRTGKKKTGWQQLCVKYLFVEF